MYAHYHLLLEDPNENAFVRICSHLKVVHYEGTAVDHSIFRLESLQQLLIHYYYFFLNI